MGSLPRIFCAAHHRSQNLVVVTAATQIAGKRMSELSARGVWIPFKKADCAHDEAGHTESTLEPLFIDDCLLNWMQPSVSGCQTLYRKDFSSAQRVCEGPNRNNAAHHL